MISTHATLAWAHFASLHQRDAEHDGRVPERIALANLGAAHVLALKDFAASDAPQARTNATN